VLLVTTLQCVDHSAETLSLASRNGSLFWFVGGHSEEWWGGLSLILSVYFWRIGFLHLLRGGDVQMVYCLIPVIVEVDMSTSACWRNLTGKLACGVSVESTEGSTRGNMKWLEKGFRPELFFRLDAAGMTSLALREVTSRLLHTCRVARSSMGDSPRPWFLGN
jgi:hypothetical protein